MLSRPAAQVTSLRTDAHLPLVLRGVEMTFRFTDESVLIDFPEFVAADPNAIPSATRSGVGSGKGPMEFDAGRHVFELIECHDHVGKIAHESACNLCDRNRRSAVHANRSG